MSRNTEQDVEENEPLLENHEAPEEGHTLPAWLAWVREPKSLSRSEQVPDCVYKLFIHNQTTPFAVQILAGLLFIFLCLTSIGFGLFAGQKQINKQRPSVPTTTETLTLTRIPITSTLTASSPPSVPTDAPSNNVMLLSDLTINTRLMKVFIGSSMPDSCLRARSGRNPRRSGRLPRSLRRLLRICQQWLAKKTSCPGRRASVRSSAGHRSRNSSAYRPSRLSCNRVALCVQRIMSNLVDDPIDSSLSKADQTNLKHIKDFYAACLDEDALDRVGSEPLLKVIRPVLKLWREKRVAAKGPWSVYFQSSFLAQTPD